MVVARTVRLLLGNRRDVLALDAHYTGFWLLVFALKVVLEYVMVLRPLVAPTRASGTGATATSAAGRVRQDLYCWGYNMLRRRNLDGYYGDGAAGVAAARATRSSCTGCSSSRPLVDADALVFGDVFVYNFAPPAPLLRPPSDLRVDVVAVDAAPPEHTAMLNLNCVGLAGHEARDHKRLEQPPDGGLADAASDAVTSEPRQVTWRRFAQAWNSVVLALRRGDPVPTPSATRACFHALSAPTPPTSSASARTRSTSSPPMPEPVLSSVGLRHAASSSPVGRAPLLQMRDPSVTPAQSFATLPTPL